VFIVKCVVEGDERAPFGVVIDQPPTLGMVIHPGGGPHVVTGIARPDASNSAVDILTIRKVSAIHDGPVPGSAAT
jgi:hypothetical protein